MFVNRTRGVVWATAGVLSLVACSDPEQKTDLRPDGPPEVLSVLVMNDAAGGLYEGATFCKQGDNKRPSQVGTPDGNLLQVCPQDLSMGVDELADANPQNWYVRIMFDELLDPNIEELSPIIDSDGNDTGTFSGSIANTKPVKLECQSATGNGLVEIPYDGYYSPSGNNVTWPLGPSLVIKANDPTLVATSSECQVTINPNVTDKDGNKVPDAQIGPYKFKIAPVALIAADTVPSDGDMIDILPGANILPVQQGVDVTFNTFIDPTSLVAPLATPDGTETFLFTPNVNHAFVRDESGDSGLPEYLFGGDFEVGTMYTWAIKQGAKIKDQCGKETTFGAPSTDDGTQVSFTTNAILFKGITPFDGQMNAKASSGVHLKFNEFMDAATLAATEYSITPAVTGLTVKLDTSSTGDIVINGNFAPNTDYTFVLKGGATIDDCIGGTAPCVKSATGGTFTNDTGDATVHFHTAATAITATVPSDNGEVDKSDATDPLDVILAFNTKMDPNTLATTEWSITPAVPMSLALTTVGSSVILESDNPIPAGDYVFTLKQGATLTDAVGGTYTQAADLAIHFTVKDPPPAGPPAPACY
jgi:hypothetical protein